MKSRYLTETQRPDFDSAITAWLADNAEDIESIPYKIALYSDGYLYRSIICSGLGDYISATNFLESLGLVNVLNADRTYRGYDALFATLEDYKKAFPAR
ncbi:hypothetical protein CVY58_RS06990 [Cronobacter sakazakii]|nr:hypothetical protein [Cronobacter sakazakii]EJG0606396.1 hypothetical protein [Cronobacter sakazakii]EJG0612065.1 hypothetical protein [Cronobacter sakazakii]EJG0616767.1 hypothetical protein [Cronobacter sakazakii]EJG0626165.1 hypothetical protein [Cronobacter sakazakii]